MVAQQGLELDASPRHESLGGISYTLTRRRFAVTLDPGPAMLDIPFTPAPEQALRSQVIDATHPGAVLPDFGAVLDYLGDAGAVKAGGKYNLLPLEAIPVLDERLARPLRLDLQRPQLRSHPYLQGLHLLGRASGLVRVEGSG